MKSLDSEIQHTCRNASVCLEKIARSHDPDMIRITQAIRILEKATHEITVLAEWKGEKP
jgi:hypothetical protein